MRKKYAGLAAVLLTSLAITACGGSGTDEPIDNEAEVANTSFHGQERNLTGISPSGAEWEARVPAHWNGTLILYGHGFRAPGDNPAWDDNNAELLDTLIEEGYAVIASSYSTTLWALGTAAEDQLDALEEFSGRDTEPARVIAYGRSMGGLVTGLLAEGEEKKIDGAVPVCGLMMGGVDLMNYQLDAAFAAAVLLVGDPDLPLTGFTSPDDSAPTVEALTTAVTNAEDSEEGRARLALVGALLNIPQYIEGVDPNDHYALSEAQAPLIAETLAEVMDRRSGVTNFSNGDSGWTDGVDYTTMMENSSHLETVQTLYTDAGLDLEADLKRLREEATLMPNEAALDWMLQTSQPTGDLQMPVFSTHTLHDLLSPVEAQANYQDKVDNAGQNELLKQAYIEREGHCEYTVSESLVAIQVIEDRLDTGKWPDINATNLNERATSLDLDDSAFVEFTPPEFINARQW